jgi:uncharacterized protein YecE (DUF72 family)
MAARIRFGTAGWDYPDWTSKVYPKPTTKGFDPLGYLAEYFQMIEINSTFYRPPTAQVARSWVKRVADQADFRFTAKLWKRFTHERAETWTKEEVAQAREGLDVLHDSGKLGAVLLQFPWSFRNDGANREWLQELTRTFAAYPLVVEVRHESWNEPGFYAELRERSLGFVNVDQPLFHDSIKPSARATSTIGYVRVHGRNYKDWFRKDAGRDARYDYFYSARARALGRPPRDLAGEPGVSEVYVVNNNHFGEGKAAANAAMLEAQTGKRVGAGNAPRDVPQGTFADCANVTSGRVYSCRRRSRDDRGPPARTHHARPKDLPG